MLVQEGFTKERETEVQNQIEDVQIETKKEETEILDIENDRVSVENELDESPIEKESEEWFKTVGLFSEVLANSMMFLQGMTVEMSDSLKQYFASRQALIKTSFQDRFEILASIDVESVTTLSKIWP